MNIEDLNLEKNNNETENISANNIQNMANNLNQSINSDIIPNEMLEAPSINAQPEPQLNNFDANSGLSVNQTNGELNNNNEVNTLNSNIPNINLQPEGMIIEEPKVDSVQMENSSPLMGTSLNENTNLFNNPSPTIENTGTPKTNFVDNNINMINPVAPDNNQINGINGVPTPPAIDELSNNNKKKKNKKEKGDKKTSPLSIIILVIAVIALIGYGVYFFLNKAGNKSKSISLILTSWEKGEKLPIEITKYANIYGLDASSCTVNNENIDINNVGRYTYTVSCPNMKEQTGEVEVLDSVGPNVTLKEVVVIPGSTVDAKDFIESCKDATIKKGCSVNFKDEEDKIINYLENEGEYDVNIVISDDYDNTTEVIGKLKVTQNAPTQKLICEKSNPPTSEAKANITERYEYSLTDANELYEAQKIRVYDFANLEDYMTIKEKYEQTGNIDDIVGKVKLEDEYKLITITTVLNEESLKKEFDNAEFSSNGTDIENYHIANEDMCGFE